MAYTLYAPDQASRLKEVLRLTGSQAKQVRFDGFGRLQEVEQQKREPMRAPSPPKLRRNR